MKSILGLLALTLILKLAWLPAAAAEPLVIATGAWPPYLGEDLPGKGPLARQVTKIFQEMGVETEIRFLPWKRAYTLTVRGDIAASFAWFWTEERSRELLVPDRPLRDFDHTVFFSRARFPDGLPETVDSLEAVAGTGHSLVAVLGYWYVEVLERHGMRMHKVGSSELAYRLVDAGRYDIFLENRDVGYWEISQFLGEEAKVRFGTHGRIPAQKLYVMFSPAHPRGRELLERYNDVTR